MARQGLRLARLNPPLQRGRTAVRDQERQDRPRRRAQGRGAEEVERLIDRVCRSGFSRELLLPLLRRQGRAGEGCLLDQPEPWPPPPSLRSEEHTSELQSLMRISYAVFCLKKKI